MYNFMDREEMLRRLHAGEDALELSIEKWDRIVDSFRLYYGPRIWGETAGGGACAQCKEYNKEEDIFKTCETCPYRKKYGHTCDNSTGHWRLFIMCPKEATAKGMRDALIATRKV